MEQFKDLQSYLLDMGCTAIPVWYSERDIIEKLDEMDTSRETHDLTEIEIDENGIGHNMVYNTIEFKSRIVIPIHVIFEATYEDWDEENEQWQVQYNNPVGWQAYI